MNRLLAYSPNLKQSWILIVIFLLCDLVSSIMAQFGIKRIAPEWVEPANSVLRYTIMALIVMRMGKGRNEEPVAPPRQVPLLWLLLVPFTVSFGMAIEPLGMWIPMPDLIQQLLANMFQKNLPVFLLTVVVAPVCEEWLFRGIILKGLLSRYSPLKAIIWSALMFGVIHFNPWQGIPVFFAGLMIGWIYWRTRSLWLCIFIHAVNNAAAFIFSAFLFPDAKVNASIFDHTGGYYIYAVALLLCVLTGMWIKNIIISSDTTPDPQNQHKPVTSGTSNYKTVLFVGSLIVVGLLLVIIAAIALNDTKRNELITPVSSIDNIVRVYTDTWHDVSLPMSIYDLQEMEIVFDDEDLKKNISEKWINTLETEIFFNDQMIGNINIDIDTRDVVRIYFNENIQTTLGEFKMGASRIMDVAGILGNPRTTILFSNNPKDRIVREYRINDNKVWFWFSPDSLDSSAITIVPVSNDKNTWAAVTIISMDAVSTGNKPVP